VLEHQARLKVAFEGARERLLVAAGRRKEQHDQQVREAPLKVGQLVYVRDHGARGRHKIQDIWSSVVHQVLKAPVGEGAVYTIAPVNDLYKVCNVHRDMPKAQIRSEPSMAPCRAPSRTPSPPAPVVSGDDSSNDGDLWLLVPETPLPPAAAVPRLSGTTNFPVAEAQPIPDTPLAEGSASATVSAPSLSQSSRSEALRRTVRSTAGQHPNVHRLPRTVYSRDQGIEQLPGLVLNAQSALFRPWC